MATEIVGENEVCEYRSRGIIKHNPTLICSIQDCNIGGSYLRNFYVKDGILHWNTTPVNYFDNDLYENEQLDKYIWMRIKR